MLLSGIALALSFGGMLYLGNLREHVPPYWCLFAGASVAYCVAVGQCSAARAHTVFAAGILFRLILVSAEPSLSEDIYRYVWDGRVQAAGINPYLHAPADEALDGLRDDVIHPRINHPQVPTIYPPAAELLFRVCNAVSPTVWSVKIAVVLFDLLGGWFLLGLLRRFNQHPGRVLIYLWNPLLVTEGAGMGHVDIIGIALMMMALLYLHLDGKGRAAAALALSFLTKLFALSLLPVFWRWMAWGRLPQPTARTRIRALLDPQGLWPVAIFAAVAGAGFWMYADAGMAMFSGLETYAGHWEFNAPLFDALKAVLGGGDLARTAVGIAFGGVVLAVTFNRRIPPVQAAYYLTGSFLLLTPTLHPWYALWILPFLAFYRRLAWLAFTLLAPVSYHVLTAYEATGVWEEAMWTRWVLFGGSAVVWIVERRVLPRRNRERGDAPLSRGE